MKRKYINFIGNGSQALHDTDFSRVRHWALDGKGKEFRQTILLGDSMSPEANQLFKSLCNRNGSISTIPTYKGSICNVLIKLPQVGHLATCFTWLSSFVFVLKLLHS